MTTEEKFVMDGNEQADQLAKDGAEEEGGAMAAAKALTIKQLSREIYASIEDEAHFHVPVEDWNDRDEMELKKEEAWQFVRKKKKQETQDRQM